MFNEKNSELMKFVIKQAKTIDAKTDAPFTAERFLILLISSGLAKNNAKLDNGETLEPCFALLEEHGLMTQAAVEMMMEYLRECTNSMSDELYMRSQMRVAQRKAVDEMLTPERLLQQMLDFPNPNIQRYEKYAKLAKDSGEPAAKSDIDRQFDELVAQLEEIQKEDAETGKMDQVGLLAQEATQMRDALLKQVLGQNHAVNTVATGMFQAQLRAMLGENAGKPMATFLFAGPPGVGKTYLAECTAQLLDRPFMRFDMSEYCDKEASIEFAGSDKVYRNGKAGNFTSFVEKNPKSVVLFDEVEKAHISIIHQFLQILDAGRIRDNYTDNEIDLKDVVLIFTTNAGHQLYENSDRSNFADLPRKVILKALEKDVNPATGNPYFPAAICSRFATGNVVMFNHMQAGQLCNIAKLRVQRQLSKMEKVLGIKINVDPRVYAAMLYAEGGSADARTIRARADGFLTGELHELFRLMNSRNKNIAGLKRVEVSVALPEDEKIRELFEAGSAPQVLAFSHREVAERCQAEMPACQLIHADDVDVAAQKLMDEDIKLVLVDSDFGVRQGVPYLNADDMDSAANDFLGYLRQRHGAVPVYLLDAGKANMENEQLQSYLDQGVQGVIRLDRDFAARLAEACGELHQQHHMFALANAHKTVSYGTAQMLSKDGATATVLLMDFKMQVAMEADDSKNVLSDISRPNVRFEQVIGAEDAKQELRYFADYLKNPKKYRGTGVQPPKGILLYGPPGTGKTMLAKAMACEADVTFICAEGNQFLTGDGPEEVHELFRTARKYAPAVLFVDEIDSIAKERGSGTTNYADSILTAFLTEMDGFKNDPSKPVFVMAATNYDVEPGSSRSLDGALMRRFDRRIYIDLPDKKARIRFMKNKCADTKHYQISESLIDNLAIRSVGMSLAALTSMFELALRTAVRQNCLPVSDSVLEEAFETFRSGEKKQWDAEQLERVARHEAGHAFLYWQAGQTPSYVTIVARGNHGGYMQHDDNEGKGIYTRNEMLSRIRTSLGGRAAELVYYGPEDGISTGASGDLANATRVAKNMICAYGMDDELGLAVVDQYASSGMLAEPVRNAVNRILQQQMEQAVTLIRENQTAVNALVAALLEKNQLTGDEICVIFETAMKKQ